MVGIFKNFTNVVYSFINSNEAYQVNWYIQYSPSNKYAELKSQIQIEEKNKSYSLLPNIIDEVSKVGSLLLRNLLISVF